MFLLPVFFCTIFLPFRIFINSKYPEFIELLEHGKLVVALIESINHDATILPEKNGTFVKINYSYQYRNLSKKNSVFIGKEDFINVKPGEEVNILVSEDGLSCIITKEFLWYIDK